MNINTVTSSLVKKQLFNRREPDSRDGLLLRIHHTSQDTSNEQVLRFIHATFNPLGSLLAIANIRGDIYLVNLSTSKYWLLQSFTSCTVLKFSTVINEELLVGQNGGDISVVSTENAEVQTTLKEHKDSVVGVSFNSKGDCLCFSKIDAILWNLREYVKIAVVCCNCSSAIKEILFVPTSNYIVGYDQDDIINIWEPKDYDVIKQIVPATWDKFRLKSVAFTSETPTKRMDLSIDGKYMVNILATGQLFVYSIAVITSNIPTNDCKEMLQYEVRNVILPKKSSYVLTDLKVELGKLLDRDKLKLILKEFNEYPNVYRDRIWSELLKLPRNSQQYNTFVIGKETHDSLTKLSRAYPLENQMVFKNMKNLMSDVIFWCPFFYSVDYLPLFVFPFVRVFKNDPVACFEAVITIIINWCQFWYEYHPLPPLNVLAIIENVLLEHDAALLSHFAKYDISTNVYAWPLMESTFSEVLLSKDWLLLWDHILTNEASFLLFAPVAYSICQRNALLSLNHKEQFQQFFHQQNPIDTKRFISKIYHLLDSTSKSNHPRYYLIEFKSLESEFYPTFHKFPSTFNVQYYDDLRALEEQSLKLVDSNLTAVKLEDLKRSSDYQKQRVENMRVLEMGRALKEEAIRDRVNVTLQMKQLRELKDELRNEQQILFDLAEMNSCQVKQDEEGASTNVKGALVGDNDVLNKQDVAEGKERNLQKLKIAVDQLILKVRQQIESSTMQPLLTEDVNLNISTLMAEMNDIQSDVRSLMNASLKFD